MSASGSNDANIGYTTDSSSPTSRTGGRNTIGLGNQAVLAGASDSPALYFLDSDAFERERFKVPQPYIEVPSGILTTLGSSVELRDMIEHYFVSVHTYFPVISKIRSVSAFIKSIA